MIKTKAKRSLSTSFFSKSHVTMSLISFQRGPAFPLVFFFIASTYRTFSCCSWCLWPDLILSGFLFPNLIPGCSGNFSVFLSGYLSLLPSSVGFLFVCLFEFAQESVVHLCRPRGIFKELPLWHASLLNLKDRILEYHPDFLAHPGPCPMVLYQTAP